MRPDLLRAVGAATAVYGAVVAARPGLLTGPSGLRGEDARTAVRPVGLRDAASGLALLLAPRGPALRTAAAVRIAADLGDAVLLGRTLPGSWRRRGAAAVGVAWGALSVAGLLLPERTGRREEGRGRGGRRYAARKAD
ncbi:hypothetical protein [Streptomyces sp. 7-21]|jgi:hypothetical protein|uniref:hypothetical protein n=1 Tax=Streptomyces sp. 7-21 TaxID=2802283 RepID=UPI00191D2C72|nr:hypothetical protein [Streptomyces sp. 7-21]MBL1067882.1 hypothetical protein [Streptomyces sp. 7-21]